MAKGTKALNPADKARREARKKELKKNKKQRQQVRSAVIEGRDPEQIIADLEKLDRLEFDIDTNPSLSDTLFKDKRKRLKDVWARILEHYQKEDPDRHVKLKKLEAEYEAKHQKVTRDFEAIKAAKEVKIEDIFLPPDPNTNILDIADDDPLMSEDVFVTPMTAIVEPPGCPPGVPPDFKLLAEGLMSPQIAPIPTIPQSLLDLCDPPSINSYSNTMPRGNVSSNRQRFNPKASSTGAGPRFDRKTEKPPQPPQTSSEIQKQPSVVTKKPAVIESKPVIFMPRATKFVPAAVRSKIKNQPKRS